MSIVLVTRDAESIHPLVDRLKRKGLNVLVNHPPGAEDTVAFCIAAGDPLDAMSAESAARVCDGIAISRWAIVVLASAARSEAASQAAAAEPWRRWLGRAAGRPLSIPTLHEQQPDLSARLHELANAPSQRAVFNSKRVAAETADPH